MTEEEVNVAYTLETKVIRRDNYSKQHGSIVTVSNNMQRARVLWDKVRETDKNMRTWVAFKRLKLA